MTKQSKKNLLMCIAILCTALPDIGAGTSTPAIAAIAQAMPEVPLTTVQLIATIPSFCLMIFVPLYAQLTKIFRKKTLVWFAFLLHMTGGVLPMFMNHIYPILFMRVLMGMSGAIIMPVTVDLIVELVDKPQQNNMLGYAAAITSIGGTVFQTLGGYLGNIDWHYCFTATLVAVPFYLFALAVLPKGNVERSEAGEEMNMSLLKELPRMPKTLWIVGGFMACWEMLYFVFLTTAAVFLVGENIANTAVVGIITSLVTVGGLVMSILFGSLAKALKKKILPLAYIVTTLGFIILAAQSHAVLAGLGALLIGVGYGLSAPCQLSLANAIVPKGSKTVATSMCYFARGVGGFISAYVFAFIATVTHTTVGRTSFVIAAGVLCVVSAAMVLFTAKADLPEITV